MNYRFNLDEWLVCFPLQDRFGRYYYGEIITSPWDVCQNENLRRELHDEYQWGPAIPVDIFIMADGEPPDRHATKIGGLPYRPANATWPTRRNGSPLVFLAQFNFSDSRDLVGELPGDLLLVFADNVHSPEHLHFEWQRCGLSGLVENQGIPVSPVVVDPAAQLMQQKFLATVNKDLHSLGMEIPPDVYQQTNFVAPCYGHILRIASFPEATRRDDSRRDLMCKGKEVRSEYFLPQYQATQIGGAPFFIQQGDRDGITGRLLCTLSSVQPAFDVDFPWLNRPQAIPLDQLRHYDKYLMIGDMGCIHISIGNDGKVHGNGSCY